MITLLEYSEQRGTLLPSMNLFQTITYSLPLILSQTNDSLQLLRQISPFKSPQKLFIFLIQINCYRTHFLFTLLLQYILTNQLINLCFVRIINPQMLLTKPKTLPLLNSHLITTTLNTNIRLNRYR